MHTVYLSLGSNLGNRRRNMLRAIAKIGELIGTVERQSAFLVTEPWGYESRHKYLNACVRVLTEHSPREVLLLTQQIERELGRRRKTTHNKADGTFEYHDRPIDIDILLYDDLTIDEPDLQIPHPRMSERDFVMIPLREIMEPPPTPPKGGEPHSA
ncbi:MAG: 2-amino-4-hydroxy-6-hydroxymethyldihydropteridine diphosphokinase [Prevotella sp.]|nr:2-amino-4-hydroxy-6-hydroxymethyldihydropteridine diphosphokinase [Prevotella sp.]